MYARDRRWFEGAPRMLEVEDDLKELLLIALLSRSALLE
jgi:hypothetical protein